MSLKDPPAAPSPLDTFDALDDLNFETANRGSDEGLLAHETLFGARGLHAELLALADRRDEFAHRFCGPTHAIADFAVTSGHEAASFFAERVAHSTGVRRSTITRCRARLAAFRDANDEVGTATEEHNLAVAAADFAKALTGSFHGWSEHRAWIRRSIQSEISPPKNIPPLDLLPRVSALIEQAITVGRFAARWSDDWHCEHGRPPMEIEARKRLRDSSTKTAALMREHAKSLVDAEHAVSDAKRAVAAAESLSREARSGEEKDAAKAVVRDRQVDYDKCCAERNKRLRSAVLVAERAQSTAAQLLADALATLECERDKSGGRGSGAAWARAAEVAKILGLVAQHHVAAAENELAAEWLQKHGQTLRRATDDFAAALSPYVVRLASIAPEGGRKLGKWLGGSWSEALIALVRDLLLAAGQGDKTVLSLALDELQREQLHVDLRIELAKAQEDKAPTPGIDIAAVVAQVVQALPGVAATPNKLARLGDGGPAQTLDAICRAILRSKGDKPPVLIAGDVTEFVDAMSVVEAVLKQGPRNAVPRDKAAQYAAPSGKLATGGWIERSGNSIVLTAKGAEDGTRRLKLRTDGAPATDGPATEITG